LFHADSNCAEQKANETLASGYLSNKLYQYKIYYIIDRYITQ